ncbi:hypothetical protein MTO96_040374 [Rhipicephalus appendiculatus]
MGILVFGIAMVVTFLVTSDDFSLEDGTDDDVQAARGGGDRDRDDDKRDRGGAGEVRTGGAPKGGAPPAGRPRSDPPKRRGRPVRRRTRRPIGGGQTPVPVEPDRMTIVIATPPPKLLPDELICTVGAFALLPNAYPPDGLCNYLFYTHVFVYNGSLVGVDVDASWKQFIKQSASLSATAGGIGFDARYVTPEVFDNQAVQDGLRTLANQNLKHYGLLNIMTRLEHFVEYMERAKNTIAKLKSIQDNDPDRRMIIALGLFDYNEPNAWDGYRAGFRKAVEQGMADTVIAISSSGTDVTTVGCYSAPTSVLDSMRLQDPARTRAKSYPDLFTHGALVAAKPLYNNNSTRLGLSLEMGTLVYSMADNETTPEGNLYHQCNYSYITEADIVVSSSLSFTPHVRPKFSHCNAQNM